MITTTPPLRLSPEDTDIFNQIIEVRRQLRYSQSQVKEIEQRCFTVYDEMRRGVAYGELCGYQRNIDEYEAQLKELYDKLFTEV